MTRQHCESVEYDVSCCAHSYIEERSRSLRGRENSVLLQSSRVDLGGSLLVQIVIQTLCRYNVEVSLVSRYREVYSQRGSKDNQLL